MQDILPILMRYRYLILASLSLLLISEMVVVGLDFVPIGYGVFGCLVALTMAAWTGILCVIGYRPTIGGDVPKRVSNIYVPNFSVDALEGKPKRRGHIVFVLSPALFVMFALLSILGASLFQVQFLLDLIGPYSPVFFMVWIGMVVIVGATVNVDYSKKTYLVVNVFPLLVLVWTMLYIAAAISQSEVWNGVLYLFGVLVVFLSYFLVVGAVVLRTMLPDKYWVKLAVISFGISVVLSVVSFIPIIFVLLDTASIPARLDTCGDCPGLAVGFFTAILIVIPVVMSLTISVPLTILIGTMGRPIRNIAVAWGVMAPMILLFVLVWFNIW